MQRKRDKSFQLSAVNRASLLRLLEDMKKRRPEQVYYLNLFNTGIVVDTKQCRNVLIELLKGVIDKKL